MSSTTTTQIPSTVAHTITPPNWINEKCHTQSIFTCNICFDISLDPVETPCDHIFCRSCIHQSLHRNRFCPNDRAPLRASQLKELRGTSKRIWSQTPVQCPECQTWTGSLQSYITEHGVSCVNPQKRIKELEGKLKEAETEVRTKTSQMQAQIEALKKQLHTALEAQKKAVLQISAAAPKTNQMQAQIEALEKQLYTALEAQKKAVLQINAAAPKTNQMQAQIEALKKQLHTALEAQKKAVLQISAAAPKTNQMQAQIEALKKQLHTALEAQKKAALQISAAAPQARCIDDNQNLAKRSAEHLRNRSHYTKATGRPFGTQQQQANIVFGQSSTILTTPSNNSTFGMNSTATSVPISNWNYQSTHGGVNVQFQIGVADR